MKYFMLSEEELKNIVSSSFEDGWYSSNENLNKVRLDESAIKAREYIIFKKIKKIENEREISLDGN